MFTQGVGCMLLICATFDVHTGPECVLLSGELFYLHTRGTMCAANL